MLRWKSLCTARDRTALLLVALVGTTLGCSGEATTASGTSNQGGSGGDGEGGRGGATTSPSTTTNDTTTTASSGGGGTGGSASGGGGTGGTGGTATGGSGGSGGEGGGCLPVAETCNGADDDCNGAIDDGLADLTCGLGTCQVTVPACVEGVPNECVPGMPSPAETCDGEDDDCDGETDEGCECIDGEVQGCYSGPAGTEGAGACVGGMQTCVDGQWGACEGEVVPQTETCNALDDDCDGAVDDLEMLTCGVGACAATTPACVNGVPQTCTEGTPSAEQCNGIDDDCNGIVDDVPPAADPNNCGGCGIVCASGICGTTIAADMTSLPQGWNFNGTAVWDAASMSGVLTQAQSNAAGTIIYQNPIVADDFSVTFQFQIGGGNGADGMGFMIQATGPTVVGNPGGGLAMSGLDGWGFELDQYANTSGSGGNACLDGFNNHASITSLAPCANALPTGLTVNTALPFALRNTGWHTALVEVTGGVATMILDDFPVITSFAIPGYTGGTFYYGFGGATGGLHDRHEIRNVMITFPKLRCL